MLVAKLSVICGVVLPPFRGRNTPVLWREVQKLTWYQIRKLYLCNITEILLMLSIKQLLYSFCIDVSMANYEVMKKYVDWGGGCFFFLHFRNCMNYLLTQLSYTFTIWRVGG
jgi:hypothetical protein